MGRGGPTTLQSAGPSKEGRVRDGVSLRLRRPGSKDEAEGESTEEE